MEIILGLLGLFILSLVFNNPGAVLLIAIGAMFVIAVIWAVCDQKKPTRKGDKCSAGHCQYCNLGRAKKAGYSDNFCYCKIREEYVQLKSECSYYKSMGCANGFCDYADFRKGEQHTECGKNVCYCRRLNQYVAAKDSCDLYSDEEAVAILKSLSGE